MIPRPLTNPRYRYWAISPSWAGCLETRSETKTKTNLYIFLTPRVIKNPGEAASVMQEKQGQMDSFRGGSFKINQGQPAKTMEDEPKVSE